jgi:putative holliday junction resolvase
MGRLIGLDHGSRRIGMAVADAETGMAFSRPALHRRGGKRDVDAVVDVARREGAEVVVLGLPLHADGTEGDQAAAARAFGERLAAAGLVVRYCDERLSSWQADRDLEGAGRQPERRSGERDSAAARVILQQYLDDRSASGRHSEEA